jgi:hypothetical protein
MNERKEMLALNRQRYDELVQMTNNALTVSEFLLPIKTLFISISFVNKL